MTPVYDIPAYREELKASLYPYISCTVCGNSYSGKNRSKEMRAHFRKEHLPGMKL